MIDELTRYFSTLTRESVSRSATFRITVMLINEVRERLNFSEALAAEIVGLMQINIADHYVADSTQLENLAREFGRFIEIIYDEHSLKLGQQAALAYLKAAAPRFELSCK